MNQLVGKVLKETLGDKQYNAEEAKQWSKEISDMLQTSLKGVLTFAHMHAGLLILYTPMY